MEVQYIHVLFLSFYAPSCSSFWSNRPIWTHSLSKPTQIWLSRSLLPWKLKRLPPLHPHGHTSYCHLSSAYTQYVCWTNHFSDSSRPHATLPDFWLIKMTVQDWRLLLLPHHLDQLVVTLQFVSWEPRFLAYLFRTPIESFAIGQYLLFGNIRNDRLDHKAYI